MASSAEQSVLRITLRTLLGAISTVMPLNIDGASTPLHTPADAVGFTLLLDPQKLPDETDALCAGRVGRPEAPDATRALRSESGERGTLRAGPDADLRAQAAEVWGLAWPFAVGRRLRSRDDRRPGLTGVGSAGRESAPNATMLGKSWHRREASALAEALRLLWRHIDQRFP